MDQNFWIPLYKDNLHIQMGMIAYMIWNPYLITTISCQEVANIVESKSLETVLKGEDYVAGTYAEGMLGPGKGAIGHILIFAMIQQIISINHQT